MLKVTKMHAVQSIGYAAAYPAYPLNPPLVMDGVYRLQTLSRAVLPSASPITSLTVGPNAANAAWIGLVHRAILVIG